MEKLLMIALTILITVSCNEQIADEIKNGQVVGTQSETEKFKNKAIRLIHKMDSKLSFTAHKAGTIDEACELQAPTLGFDAKDYSKSDKSRALDCIIDVEELDLFLQGVEFEVQVDKFLCEYITYTPFKFMKFKPGRSHRSTYKVECDTGCESAPALAGKCGNSYELWGGTTGSVGGVTDFATQISNPSQCIYDYDSLNPGSTSSFPNCDEGTTTETIIQFSTNADITPSVCNITNPVAQDPVVTECGGDMRNCAAGPSIQEYPDLTHSSTIYENTSLETFTKSWKYSSPLSGNFRTNMNLANFSRTCSDQSIKPRFDDSVFESVIEFKGDIFERIKYASTQPFTNARRSVATLANPDSTDYAEHAHRSPLSVTPYYAIECLDRAYDIKAQIRLHIREWDRTFTSNANALASISDIGKTSGDKLMDRRNDTYDTTRQWNSRDDWDDFYEDRALFEAPGKINQCTDSRLPFDNNNFPGNSL